MYLEINTKPNPIEFGTSFQIIVRLRSRTAEEIHNLNISGYPLDLNEEVLTASKKTVIFEAILKKGSAKTPPPSEAIYAVCTTEKGTICKGDTIVGII